MKKMILLLVLPLTASMAIDFTMTKEGLFNSNTITQSPASATAARSSYEKQITLPKCDANNPEVQFIRSTSDWSHINDADKRIFCVSPGNYISLGKIQITADGTKDNPKYIVLNNGNNIHPAQLKLAERANLRLFLNGANYWIIDRMSLENHEIWKEWELAGQASDNIINRAYFKNTQMMIYLGGNCNRNVIQNSAFYDMTTTGLKADHPAINFNGNAYDSIVVNNEMRNTNDAIQTTGARTKYSVEGSIFDSNTMWIDPSIYADADGTPNTNGAYSIAENAIDLKVGSTNPDKPLIISNNVMWGFRYPVDKQDFGVAIVMHYNIQNTVVRNNIIFDSAGGVQVGDGGVYEYGAQGVIFEGNTLWQCGQFKNTPIANTASFKFRDNKDIVIKNNYIIDGRYRSIIISSSNIDTHITGNTFIEAMPISNGSVSSIIDGNKNYNSSINFPNTKILTSSNVVYIDFTYDIFTSNPKIKKIKTIMRN